MTLQNSADQFLTGTGILVQGDPFFGNTKGHNGQPLKDGRVEYFVAIAFPKDQPQATNFDALYAVMQQVAVTHKYAATYQASQWVGFHWKLEDGDAPQNVTKPGFKGCWVLKFKNGFQPNVFDEKGQIVPSPYEDGKDAQGNFVQTRKPGPHTFPKGHYVRVMCAVKSNDVAPPQSGLYLNFTMIQRVGYGTEIQTGPDYSQVINQNAAAALPGMSAMPTGSPSTPAGAAAPGMPGMPGGAPAGGAPGMPGLPGAGATVTPGMPGTPGGAVPGMPGMPGAPSAPATPPPAAVETPQQRMLVNDYSYDQYIASGQWTEELLIQHGKMRPAAAASAPGVPGVPGGPGMPGTPPAAGTLPGPGHVYNQ